jgi:hypothetical protein
MRGHNVTRRNDSTLQQWTYEQLTDVCESLLSQPTGRKLPHTSRTDGELLAWDEGYQYGLYRAWFQMTDGAQKTGDDERMRKLAKLPF